MTTFLPAYLQALGKHLAPYVDSDRMVKSLMASTAKMVQNNHPDQSLMEVFDHAFYPSLGLSKSDLAEPLERFYAVEFPHLKSTTEAIPEAIDLVQEALRRGYQVGIATTPLFPQTAIVQRLTWAGLSPQEYPFALIPSYSSFHFAKPNPAYFTEFLAQMGWPEGKIAMVGDEAELDIVSARQIGLPVFWVQEKPGTAWDGQGDEPPHGSQAEVLSWIESLEDIAFQPKFETPPALLFALSSTPAALQTLSQEIPEEQWAVRPSPAEWSLTEILCHLRDVDAEVNLPRLIKVFEDDNPFLSGKDTDPWAEERQYIRQNGRQALQSFIEKRLEILKLMNSLDKNGWERPARHAIFGPTHFKELVYIINDHDRLHIRQVYALIHAEKSIQPN